MRNTCRYETATLSGILLTILCLCVPASAVEAASKPQGSEAVASVDGELVTAEALRSALASAEQGDSEEDVLNRLINVKLIIQEARRIGLDELPEVEKLVDVQARITLRELVLEEHAGKIEVTEEEIEPLYRDAVREYKITSVLFEKEEDANALKKEVDGGARFEDLVGKAIDEKRAKGMTDVTALKGLDLRPEFTGVLADMKPGETSAVIKTDEGFALVKLEEVLYPDNAAARQEAEQEARRRKITESVRSYVSELKKKHAKVDEKLLEELDFEADPSGFGKLLEDRRILADLGDDEPITVADLAQLLKEEFYHGITKAIESKKVNERKHGLFEEALRKKVLRKEALLKGIDQSEKYQSMMEDYEESVLFGAFVRKVVARDVKVSRQELQDYYDEHLAEYSTPEMMRVNCLIFRDAESAAAAAEKLGKAAEFSWLKSNADGQVPRETEGLLDCEGKLVATRDLEKNLQAALSNPATGNYRMYTSPEGFYYVFQIHDVVPSRPAPFAEVGESIAKTVYESKLQTTVEEWARKLREASEVEIYRSALRK